jgi:hypothetical protein|tara:strand:+ start:2105 stop:2317 length:213 start_codon:yes stop_codon:yes gene_type:complete
MGVREQKERSWLTDIADAAAALVAAQDAVPQASLSTPWAEIRERSRCFEMLREAVEAHRLFLLGLTPGGD